MRDYLELFTRSYERATGARVEGQEFLARFYDVFTKTSQDIAGKFQHTDMLMQRQQLLMSLNYMIYFSIDRRASDELLRVARLHNKWNLNIQPQLYEMWLDSLLETAELFDSEFDAEVELAWRVILAPGIAYMKAQFSREESGGS